jgi:hypothetical protein
MWFATDFGLTYFDGIRFVTYGRNHGIAATSIMDIAATKDSLLFISYPSTLQSISNNGKVRTLGILEGFAGQQIEKIGNDFYIYKRNGPIAIWKNNTLTRISTETFFQKNEFPTSICSNGRSGFAATTAGIYSLENSVAKKIHAETGITSIAVDGSMVYFVVGNKIKLLNKNGSSTLATLPTKQIILHTIAKNNELWLRGQANGLYNVKNGRVTDIGALLNLNNKAVNKIFVDKRGDTWFNTDGNGVYHKRSNGFEIFDTNEGLTGSSILQIIKVRDKVLLGTNNGISYYQNNTVKPINIPRQNNMLQYVQCLSQLNDTVNFYTENCSLSDKNTTFKINADNIPFKWYSAMFIWNHSNDEKWLFQGNNARVLNKTDNLLKTIQFPDSFTIRRTYTASKYRDQYWIGTNKGILQLLPNGTIKKVDNINGIHFAQVFAITPDQTGTLWIATDNGVFYLRDGKYFNLPLAKTQGGNYSRSLFIDAKNKVWVGTWDGVFTTDGKMKKFLSLSASNKLTNSIYVDYTTNKIFLGTENGLAVGDLSLVEQPKEKLPIKLNVQVQDSVPIANNQTISANYKSISFNFSIPFYEANEDLFFEYKLDDGIWQRNNTGKITLSALGSGEHKVQLRAIIGEEVISETISFAFKVRTPFYKTWWFWLAIALIAQILIYKILKKRNRKIVEAKEKQQKQEIEFASLKQQAFTALMNPHFIFNALNSVQFFVNKQDRLNANRYLSDFAILIRKSFYSAQKNFMPLDEELETIRYYLRLEQMRFGDKVRYQINIDNNVIEEDWILPSLLLQPFVENALLHGIGPLSIPGNIIINISTASSQLIIDIIDNGIGMERSIAQKIDKKHISKGMTLIEERIKLLSKLCDKPLSLQVTEAYPDEVNKGTHVRITIPDVLNKIS